MNYKNIGKYAAISWILTVLLYALSSFINLSFNPVDWGSDGRVLFASAFFVFQFCLWTFYAFVEYE